MLLRRRTVSALTALVAATALAAALTGCGGDDDASPGAPRTSAVADPSTSSGSASTDPGSDSGSGSIDPASGPIAVYGRFRAALLDDDFASFEQATDERYWSDLTRDQSSLRDWFDDTRGAHEAGVLALPQTPDFAYEGVADIADAYGADVSEVQAVVDRYQADELAVLVFEDGYDQGGVNHAEGCDGAPATCYRPNDTPGDLALYVISVDGAWKVVGTEPASDGS